MKNILIIDDDPKTRRLVRRRLKLSDQNTRESTGSGKKTAPMVAETQLKIVLKQWVMLKILSVVEHRQF